MEYCKDCKLPDGSCGKCRKESDEQEEEYKYFTGNYCFKSGTKIIDGVTTTNVNSEDYVIYVNFDHSKKNPYSYVELIDKNFTPPSLIIGRTINELLTKIKTLYPLENKQPIKKQTIWDKIKRIFNGK